MMKRMVCAALLAILIVTLNGCDISVLNSVEISNVMEESFRPDGYEAPTSGIGMFDWAGFKISGEITNTSNQTIANPVVVIRLKNDTPVGKHNERIEISVGSLQPKQTRTFSHKVIYGEDGVSYATFGWKYEILDVLNK